MSTAPARVTSGIDLLVLRRSLGLRQEDVAVAMAVRRQRVSALERMYRPPARAIERYLAALEQIAAR